MDDPVIGYRLFVDGTQRPIFGGADGKAYLVEPTGQRTYCLFAVPGDDWCDLPLATDRPSGGVATGLAEEHRGRPRYPGAGMARLVTSGSPNEWKAQVRDVSVTGLGLLSRRSQPRGTFLSVAFAFGDRTSPERQVVVMHATPLANQEVLLGCRFARPLREEELSALRAG